MNTEHADNDYNYSKYPEYNTPITPPSPSPSPVTEHEMRSFFDRLATNFVGLSDQAIELTELKLAVSQMQTELATLRETNAILQAQVLSLTTSLEAATIDNDEAWKITRVAETERDQHKAHADTLQRENEGFSVVIAQQQDTINTLQKHLAEALEAKVDLAKQCTQLGHRVDQLELSNSGLRESNQRQYDVLNDALDANKALQSDLAEAIRAKAEVEEAQAIDQQRATRLTEERDYARKEVERLHSVISNATSALAA